MKPFYVTKNCIPVYYYFWPKDCIEYNFKPIRTPESINTGKTVHVGIFGDLLPSSVYYNGKNNMDHYFEVFPLKYIVALIVHLSTGNRFHMKLAPLGTNNKNPCE